MIDNVVFESFVRSRRRKNNHKIFFCVRCSCPIVNLVIQVDEKRGEYRRVVACPKCGWVKRNVWHSLKFMNKGLLRQYKAWRGDS